MAASKVILHHQSPGFFDLHGHSSKAVTGQIHQVEGFAETEEIDGLGPARRTAGSGQLSSTREGQVRIMASPLYKKNPPPRYPKRARKKGYEGTVILEVLVDENGIVKDLRVFESSGYDLLDKSAIASLRRWQFTPGTEDGDPARMWVRIPVRFKLK